VAPRKTHWVELLLDGTGANRRAIGARVTVRPSGGAPVQTRFVNGGNGFAAQSTRRIHFGLGEATAAEHVEIIWPSGRRQAFENVPADRILRAKEPNR
jgi:hypothetical protein